MRAWIKTCIKGIELKDSRDMVCYKDGADLLLLHEGDLDVAGAGHVGVDPSVGPVSPPPHLGGAVHLHGDYRQPFGEMPGMFSVSARVSRENIFLGYSFRKNESLNHITRT